MKSFIQNSEHRSTGLSAKRRLGVAALLAIAACAAPASSFAYNGNAQGVVVKALGIAVPVVGDTGQLPPTGGEKKGALATANVNTPAVTVTGKVAAVKTKGADAQVESVAQITGLKIAVLDTLGTAVGGLLGAKPNQILNLSASTIDAKAKAGCGQETTASSKIAGLKINDKMITVSGQPNQVVSLAVGQVIINEQVPTANGISVNAIHVSIAGLADVIVSHAEAGVNCDIGADHPIVD